MTSDQLALACVALALFDGFMLGLFTASYLMNRYEQGVE